MIEKVLKVILLISSFLCFKVDSVYTIAKFGKLAGQTDGNLGVELFLDYFSFPEVTSKNLFLVTVTGKQGIMKSTLLRGLGRYFNLNHADFVSGDSALSCTREISLTEPTENGVVLVDQPGKDDGYLSYQTDIASRNIDLMFTRLIAPVTNILIHVFFRGISRSDLEELAMVCDQKYQVGKLQTREFDEKPILIIAIRGKALDCRKDNVEYKCTADEYVNFIIPKNHVARTTFQSIHAVLIPQIVGNELYYLQKETFEPEKIPHYWSSIGLVKEIISKSQSKDQSKYWTGEELEVIFKNSLNAVNALSEINVPDLRASLVLLNVEKFIKNKLTLFLNDFNTFYEDPFNPLHTLEKITTTKKEYEKSLFDQFAIHSKDEKLWELTEAKVRTRIDEIYNEILLTIENKKNKIINEINNLYESSSLQISDLSSKILSKIVGDPEIINGEFTNELTAVLEGFYKKAKDTKGDTSSIDILYNRLKERSITSIDSAHTANEIKHINRKLELQKKGLPPIEFSIHERHSHCGNGGVDHHFNLLEKAPNYFSDNILPSILSIDLKFHGSHGGNGRLILQGNNQEYPVHQTSTRGEKGHSSGTFYNPVTKNLRVHLEGWGWGHGNCNNRKEMSSLQFTITPNGLYDSPPHYSQDYKKGTNTLIE